MLAIRALVPASFRETLEIQCSLRPFAFGVFLHCASLTSALQYHAADPVSGAGMWPQKPAQYFVTDCPCLICSASFRGRILAPDAGLISRSDLGTPSAECLAAGVVNLNLRASFGLRAVLAAFVGVPDAAADQAS
jgi:hypothetical protein